MISKLGSIGSALPFWSSLLLPILISLCAWQGGVWLYVLPFLVSITLGVLDRYVGRNKANLDPNLPEVVLFWHRLITYIWPPLQLGLIFGSLYFVANRAGLNVAEELFLFISIGVATGSIGINYAHELMHQKPEWERGLADILLASVLYSHFRSEHLLVHHRYVATPRDPVSARYNESFHRFFWRVIPQSFCSALSAEAHQQSRAKRSAWSLQNPFWRFAILQLMMLLAAFAIAGVYGLALFILQAFIAIGHLEVTNYVEHYGLTRQHLGDGKYEHVKPHHSWNADHQVSNWLLINLQRHSDHHYKPDRRFPLLQTYDKNEAPQLPYSYPMMTAIAMSPRLWRKTMNKRVQSWRARHYPDIEDWTPYNKGTTPMPR